jgi:hypothetical protein
MTVRERKHSARGVNKAKTQVTIGGTGGKYAEGKQQLDKRVGENFRSFFHWPECSCYIRHHHHRLLISPSVAVHASINLRPHINSINIILL